VLRKSHGTITLWRSWGPRKASSRTPWHATQGETFGGLTRRGQEPRGMCHQGSNCSNSSMGFRATSTTIHRPARGWAPEAPCVLEPKESSGLLRVSPPHQRGGLRRHHVFIMSHPICNYIHRIVHQFYVYFCALTPHVVSYFFPISPLV
jgi:hypothetical protein